MDRTVPFLVISRREAIFPSLPFMIVSEICGLDDPLGLLLWLFQGTSLIVVFYNIKQPFNSERFAFPRNSQDGQR
jgi:hypothetical protein